MTGAAWPTEDQSSRCCRQRGTLLASNSVYPAGVWPDSQATLPVTGHINLCEPQRSHGKIIRKQNWGTLSFFVKMKVKKNWHMHPQF